jgi:hypothetical protein
MFVELLTGQAIKEFQMNSRYVPIDFSSTIIIVVNNIFYAGRYLEKYHQLCGNFSS